MSNEIAIISISKSEWEEHKRLVFELAQNFKAFLEKQTNLQENSAIKIDREISLSEACKKLGLTRHKLLKAFEIQGISKTANEKYLYSQIIKLKSIYEK